METAVASDCNYEISWISDNYLKFKIKKSPVKRSDSNSSSENIDILDRPPPPTTTHTQQPQEQQSSQFKRERLQFEDEEDEGGVDKVTSESSLSNSIDLKANNSGVNNSGVNNSNNSSNNSSNNNQPNKNKKKKHKKQKSKEDLNSNIGEENSISNASNSDSNNSGNEEIKPSLENLKIDSATVDSNNNNNSPKITTTTTTTTTTNGNNNGNNNNSNNNSNNSNNNNSNNSNNSNNNNNNNNNNNDNSESNNSDNNLNNNNSYNEDLVYSGNTILGTRDENQDSFFHKNKESDKIRIIGVFDGHGDEGVIASTTSRDVISTYFSSLKSDNKDYDNFIKNSFQLTNQTLLEKGKDTGDWGTTATIAIIDRDQIKVGWVGDSMAVLFRSNSSGKDYTPIQLSNDHKPENAQEKKRITSTGGRVVFRCGCWRVIPNKSDYSNEEIMKQRLALNMSRALGHIVLSKYGVSSDPEIQNETLKPGDYVILASDGLWNVLCLKTIVKYIKKSSNPKELTDILLNVVESRCQSFKIPCDNVTICCYRHLS